MNFRQGRLVRLRGVEASFALHEKPGFVRVGTPRRRSTAAGGYTTFTITGC
ncbi:MAG TPA: hypothetical protein VF611_05495 [Pyrinomonadaceae bacterium]|jgi:L-amino acid N-acyltransferase YncA